MFPPQVSASAANDGFHFMNLQPGAVPPLDTVSAFREDSRIGRRGGFLFVVIIDQMAVSGSPIWGSARVRFHLVRNEMQRPMNVDNGRVIL